jgi:hypothetical protein
LDETSVMPGADAPRLIAERILRFKTEHFAEAFIEGREFHLALLERITGVEVLPIPEILFEGLKAPAIYGYDAKWTPDSAAYVSTKRRFGLERDEPELAERLKKFAFASWTLFGFSGYARIDFRVDPTGAPFIIDVNPNPYLTVDTEDAAAAAGGWALLPGLDRQHRRERAESFPNQRSTSFATKDRLERGSPRRCGRHPNLGSLFGAAMSKRDSEQTGLLS